MALPENSSLRKAAPQCMQTWTCSNLLFVPS